MGETCCGKKKMKRKTKKEKIIASEINNVDMLSHETKDEAKEKKRSKAINKRRKIEKTKKAEAEQVAKFDKIVDYSSNQRNGKSRKIRKVKKKDRITSQNAELLELTEAAKQDEVYEISSGDEDCSQGMKKWIMEYHQSRPGIKILQERIDDFIISHEAQQEQERKEREARAAEGGWTVVVHHKGRKKTTDSESGTTVGSVAPAALVDKMAKKKSKEVGLDFYRFQKREAKRNEIMMLQSKFEQDKKRIQQMRAARKFRPY